SATGARAFDVDFSRRLFGEAMSIAAVSDADFPELGHEGEGLGAATKATGNRIGFDLGGSDRKCAAVIDGEVVFSEEITWDPYFQSDPNYHIEGIRDSLRRAAAHLPSVDAIGGSAAGVYVDNQVLVASLFRGVPDDLYESHVKNLFIDLAHEWNDVPFRVVNDGDVTALAGSISLDDGAVLGLAMGTSTAAGYVDESRNITDRISELAFVPLDYREDAPADEWSGDHGCQVQYFSQQAVSRLIPASGLPIDASLGKPEQLVKVQEFMAAGDDRAAAIYRTIGTYLGYAIPHVARFYAVRHWLLLGRVMTGEGGELIIKHARAVLADEFPDLAKNTQISTPDEQMKRHGQAIAAASLPKIPSV
ncbi:MAG: ROK family protein, partial [Luteolibacter sp.]